MDGESNTPGRQALTRSRRSNLGEWVGLITGCRFTLGARGNVDGTTVVALPPFPGSVCSNYVFDPVTDPGTLYYHCMGYTPLATGNTFTVGAVSEGEFWFTEPGNVGQFSAPVVISGNTVNLNNKSNWHFCGILDHNNPRTTTFPMAWSAASFPQPQGLVMSLRWLD